ncbi:unnamed protein product [Linum trigynum]|uniref:Uncharacterized protein n=1 Tax=Linum trigynum TaxID=586398 RepID=A0AAV2EV88_9ROSI
MRSGTSAGIIIYEKDLRLLVVSTPEEEITERQAENDGEEDAAVERHDGQHQQVPHRRVHPKQDRSGEASRTRGGLGEQERSVDRGRRGRRTGGGLEPDAAIFHVLVKGGEEETG